MKKRSSAGRRIKRFFIFLLFLAAAAAVFYFGFYRFQMPSDTYGVIFTRYSGGGWQPEVLSPGQLRFEWRGLLPMNVEMERFRLLPVKTRVSTEGRLPSSDTYATYLEGNPDFSYSFTFDISYTVKADSLYSLVNEDFLRSSNLDEWYKDTETALVSDAVDFITKTSRDDGFMKDISYNYRLLEDALIEDLSSKYDYLEFTGFVPVKVSFPDMKLYAEGKRQFYVMESLHNDVQTKSVEETSKRLIEESAKIELLQKYGEIFSKYPELIQYYSIFSGQPDLLPKIQLPGDNPQETQGRD